jgi:hypothetical protein
MEKGDNGTFEFGSSTRVDSVGRECFPNDVFTNVGSDEKRDTGSETVAFGQELVEEHDDEGCRDELEDEQEADTGAEGRGGTVETSEDVDGGLAEGDDECEH